MCMDCHRMQELLPLLASGDLEGSLFTEARAHVAGCEVCRDGVFEYGAQGMLLRASAGGHAPAPLWADLKLRLKPRDNWGDIGGEA